MLNNTLLSLSGSLPFLFPNCGTPNPIHFCHMKRTAPSTQFDQTLSLYNSRLESKVTKAHQTIPVWKGFSKADPDLSTITLECWEIDPANLPVGFTVKTSKEKRALGEPIKYQYDLRSDKKGRPAAWRIPFLAHDGFEDRDYTVSHLCHNPLCYNPGHHAFESLPINKARNGCPGGAYCFHRQKCIRPGPFYNS